MRIIQADELRAHVRFEDLIEPVSKAFQQSSAGQAENGLIVMSPLADRARGDVYVKSGTLASSPVFIVKVSPWFAGNLESGRPQGGFVAVFSSKTGYTLAIFDEQHYLSDIRTAAAGALAARTLARARIHTASVLGSGVQAYWQTLALFHERPFDTLNIWARSETRAAALGDRLRPLLRGARVRLCSLEEAVRSADAIVTATLAREPILRGEWLKPGAHVTAVGADDPTKCEVDPAALVRARVFVDAIQTTTKNGDIHRAIQAGEYSENKIAGELGDVLAGRRQGRTAEQDITIAKFVGIGVQDLVAAQVSLEKLPATALAELQSSNASAFHPS